MAIGKHGATLLNTDQQLDNEKQTVSAGYPADSLLSVPETNSVSHSRLCLKESLFNNCPYIQAG